MKTITLARTLSVALVALLMSASVFAAAADTVSTNPPPPVPLPQAHVTIPPMEQVTLQNGTVLSALSQVKSLELLNGLPILYVIASKNQLSDYTIWSLITPAQVRVFSVDASKYPEVADYLASSHTMTQPAYVLDIPPTQAGVLPVHIGWINERNGVLNQATLEAIYRKAGISIDPLTAPVLDAPAYVEFHQKAIAQDPKLPAAKTMVFLAYRSKVVDQDVAALTRLRILMGVEFVKSVRIPVLEMDEDTYPALWNHLTSEAPTTGPELVVYDLVNEKVLATYAAADLETWNEDTYQKWALANGTPAFVNTKTDVAEVTAEILMHLRDKGVGQRADNGQTGSLRDASLTLVGGKNQ